MPNASSYATLNNELQKVLEGIEQLDWRVQDIAQAETRNRPNTPTTEAIGEFYSYVEGLGNDAQTLTDTHRRFRKYLRELDLVRLDAKERGLAEGRGGAANLRGGRAGPTGYWAFAAAFIALNSTDILPSLQSTPPGANGCTLPAPGGAGRIALAEGKSCFGVQPKHGPRVQRDGAAVYAHFV